MHNFNRRLLLTITLALLVALPAVAGDAVEERYSALALSMGTTATGARAVVTIGITGWTSAEDRERLLRTLVEKGHKELKSELFKQDQIGFIKVGNSLGYPLRYIWESKVDGKRHIVLATERPLNAIEVMRNSRSRDHDIALIKLVVDEKGKGEGSLAAAVELNVEDNHLEIKTHSSEPVRLMSVKRLKK